MMHHRNHLKPAAAALITLLSLVLAPTATAEAETPLPYTAYVSNVASVRKTPSDAKKIDDPSGNSEKQISNWVGMAYRGDKVEATAIDGEWTEITLPGGDGGFIQSRHLVPQKGWLHLAAKKDLRLFDRPRYAALSTSVIPGGSLVFTGQEEGDFLEVNWPGSHYSSREGWIMLSDREFDENEMGGIRLLAKIRYLHEKGDPKWESLAEVALEQYPDATVLKAYLPTAGEEEAPTE